MLPKLTTLAGQAVFGERLLVPVKKRPEPMAAYRPELVAHSADPKERAAAAGFKAGKGSSWVSPLSVLAYERRRSPMVRIHSNHVPPKTANIGTTESALSGRFRVGSVISSAPE